jgi:hypothetical protein
MLPRCPFAQSFHSIVSEGIKLPEEISPELLARVLQSLTTLYHQLQASMSPTHYPSVSGRHYCLKHAYEEAVIRMQNLAAFPLPVPKPEPPAQRPQPPSLETIVKHFETLSETDFGSRAEEKGDASN